MSSRSRTAAPASGRGARNRPGSRARAHVSLPGRAANAVQGRAKQPCTSACSGCGPGRPRPLGTTQAQVGTDAAVRHIPGALSCRNTSSMASRAAAASRDPVRCDLYSHRSVARRLPFGAQATGATTSGKQARRALRMQAAVEAAGETAPGRATARRAHPRARLGNGGQSRGGRPRPGPEDLPPPGLPAVRRRRHHGGHARKRRRQAGPRGTLNILDEGGRSGPWQRGWPEHRPRRATAGPPGRRNAPPARYGYLEFGYAYSVLFGGRFFPRASLSRLA